MNRICNRCNEDLPLEEFNKNKCGKYGVHSICKKCCSIRTKKFRKDNPDIMFNRYKKHYEKNKISIGEKTTKYIKENPHIRKKSMLNYYYGLSLEAYHKLIDDNNGKCHICNCIPDKFYVDHCHVTNKIRGVLCVKCNSLLGFCNDNIEILKSATDYLTKEYIYGVAN